MSTTNKDKILDLEDKVMSQIKSGHVQLRSRLMFLAEKLGMKGIFLLCASFAVIFFALVLFYLKQSDNLVYLSFGSRGLYAFLESFPYLLVVSFLILIFIAGFIIRQNGWLYKQSFGRLAFALVVFVVLLGGVLALTNIAEQIEQGMYNSHSAGQIIHPFLGRGLSNRARGLSGRVIEVGADFVNVQTPWEIIRVDMSALSLPVDIEAGEFMIAVGHRQANGFVAEALHALEEDDMPMIGRGVRRQFGNYRPMVPGCLQACFGADTPSGTCREACFVK